MTVLVAGVVGGYFLGCIWRTSPPGITDPFKLDSAETLPEDLRTQLDRFSFINRSTSQSLKEFRVFGTAMGPYVKGGEVFETYVIGFEDRYGGAEADLDFLDLMVELKRVRGSQMVTVRIVQLGLDTIEVYLDGQSIGRVSPAMEIQISSLSD